MSQSDVIAMLKKHGELTTDGIKEKLGDVSRQSVKNAITRLRQQGLLEVRQVKTSKTSSHYKYRLKDNIGV